MSRPKTMTLTRKDYKNLLDHLCTMGRSYESLIFELKEFQREPDKDFFTGTISERPDWLEVHDRGGVTHLYWKTHADGSICDCDLFDI